MLNFKLINFLIVYIFFVYAHESLNETIDAQRELDNFYLCDYKCDTGEICIYTNEQNNIYKCIKKEEYDKELKIDENKSSKKRNSNKCKNEKNCEISSTYKKKIPKSFLCNNRESKKCENQICLKNKNKIMCLCPSGQKFENNKCTDMVVINKKCPEHLCDNYATCFLNESQMKFKCICDEGYWGFGNVCFPLKNSLSNEGRKKKKKNRKQKNDNVENKEKPIIESDKENLENIGTTNDSIYNIDKTEKIQNLSRKKRILNDEDCKIDCGLNGICIKRKNYEFCICTSGYSSNLENNFLCEEHCKVNNGGCDPNATCESVSSENEEANNVIRKVGVICKCKNGDTRYNGYYCSSSYLMKFNFFILILFFLYLFH
ncbi:conserved Plasmodium protein, unknown function [Plasmodium gallinaceum]|uniref:EGF-like domain-containing protein n=1 Tax=Plasmodium gallinaceum TaxID=5849 RepID=A0A1J1GTC7_PLAGA|nr:conserved Plasmodium protein, unknown function [Plasmodium gallinaceum]CRG95552.1 conserved Plasmodium protein, unknown function [Plasmodium gallinaceum]